MKRKAGLSGSLASPGLTPQKKSPQPKALLCFLDYDAVKETKGVFREFSGAWDGTGDWLLKALAECQKEQQHANS